MEIPSLPSKILSNPVDMVMSDEATVLVLAATMFPVASLITVSNDQRLPIRQMDHAFCTHIPVF